VKGVDSVKYCEPLRDCAGLCGVAGRSGELEMDTKVPTFPSMVSNKFTA
jgi:hypothetical protein